jgi:hypothetical protein
MNLDYKKLLEWLEGHDMSVQVFADILRLSGIKGASRARLNQAFQERDPLPLSPDVAAEVQKVWDILGEIEQAAGMLKISLRDAEHVHLLISLWRRGFVFATQAVEVDK